MAAKANDDIPLEPARAGEMVPIYPVTVEAVVVYLLNAAVVLAEEEDVVTVGAAAGRKERVDAVVAEERRKGIAADHSVPDLTNRLVN